MVSKFLRSAKIRLLKAINGQSRDRAGTSGPSTSMGVSVKSKDTSGPNTSMSQSVQSKETVVTSGPNASMSQSVQSRDTTVTNEPNAPIIRSVQSTDTIVISGSHTSMGVSVQSVHHIENAGDFGLFRLLRQPLITENADSTPETASNGIGSDQTVGPCSADIVAIHGLGGTAFKTWTHDNGKLWLRDFALEEFPGARIYTFGYDSRIAFTMGTGTLRDFARSLLAEMKVQRATPELNCRPLIFVCHSMGGLVAKLAITIAQNESDLYPGIGKAVTGILFLGTPHQGSPAASYASILARTASALVITSQLFRSVGQMRDDLLTTLRTQEPELLRIAEDFRVHTKNLKIMSFVEGKKMRGLRKRIVDNRSAFVGASTERIIPMPGYDHREICRHGLATDPGLQLILGAIRECLPTCSQLPPTRPTLLSKECFPFVHIAQRNQAFVGQKHILKQLRVLFDDHSELSQVSLYGLGGIGKSQIALEYAHEIKDNNHDTSIFWVFAGSKERFQHDYQEIAAGLQLPGYNDPEADVLSLVKRALENPDSKKWVMIIDNADDLSLFYDKPPSDLDMDRGNLSLQRGLFNYIPCSQNGSILFTTRSKADALQLTSGGRVIKVTEMSDEDLMSLLRTKFDGEIPEDYQWLDLIKVLERLPLAIVQAASYTRQMCWTVTKYLEYFQRQDLDVQLLLHDFWDKTRDITVANSVFKTWMITVQQLETQHPLAAEVLWTMAYYNRLNIPRFLLIRSLTARGFGDASDYHLDKAIGTLIAYSFINVATGKQGESYTMHRLLQVFARYWLKEHRGTAAEWASKALASLRLELPKLEYENWAKYAELLPHLAELIDFRPVSSLPVDDFGISLIAGAAYLEVRAQYLLASHYANLALKTLCENHGDEHPTTADARCRLASIYRDMGQLQEAESLSRSAIRIYGKILGSCIAQSLGALQTLSGVLRQQGKFEEAEILAREFAKAIAIHEGQEALITLEAQIDLAAILGDTGRYEESLQLQKVVADVMRKKYGPEHPKLAYVLHDLAITLNMNGQFEEACELSENVFELNSKFYGPVHPRTSNIEYNLGLALNELGDFEEAERHFQHVLDFRKRHTDERSRIGTIECIQNLARCLERQRKYDSAAGYYQLAVESVTNFGLSVKLADTMSACQVCIKRCLKLQEKSDDQDFLDKVDWNAKITSPYPYQREYGDGGEFRERCGG